MQEHEENRVGHCPQFTGG